MMVAQNLAMSPNSFAANRMVYMLVTRVTELSVQAVEDS